MPTYKRVSKSSLSKTPRINADATLEQRTLSNRKIGRRSINLGSIFVDFIEIDLAQVCIDKKPPNSSMYDLPQLPISNL